MATLIVNCEQRYVHLLLFTFFTILVVILLVASIPVYGTCIINRTLFPRTLEFHSCAPSNLFINNYVSRNTCVIHNKQFGNLSPLVQACRNITVVSRCGKRKTCKAVLKRFRRVKGGLLKRWRSGKVQKMRKKNSWKRFRLRGSVLVTNKTQLKTLNKMMYKQ